MHSIELEAALTDHLIEPVQSTRRSKPRLSADQPGPYALSRGGSHFVATRVESAPSDGFDGRIALKSEPPAHGLPKVRTSRTSAGPCELAPPPVR